MTKESARPHLKFYVAVALALSMLAAVVLIVVWPSGPSSQSFAEPEPPVIPCAAGLLPVAGGCLALPARAVKGTPVLVYLHGLYSKQTEAEEMERQARVARLGVAHGFAVLAVRGEPGECKNDKLPDTYCWPSNARNESDGAAFVARWKAALAEADNRAGGQGPHYLLGFSNGGYFAALIATRALSRFDAIVVAHAGSVPPVKAAGPKPPMLLVSADDDPSDPDVAALDAELSREKWPHAVVAREGGHALLDWDVGVAVAFFARVQQNKPPFSPPLARGRATPSAVAKLDPPTSAEPPASAAPFPSAAASSVSAATLPSAASSTSAAATRATLPSAAH